MPTIADMVDHMDLTLTSVVFELHFVQPLVLVHYNLTLTSVVFECASIALPALDKYSI